MDFVEQVKERINCCACGNSLKNSEHVNLCATGKVAAWKFPSSGNVYIHNAPNEAVAILCDECIKSKHQTINAIELLPGEDGFNEVIYHRLEDLEDEPEWVQKAKEKLSRPSPILN